MEYDIQGCFKRCCYGTCYMKMSHLYRFILIKEFLLAIFFFLSRALFIPLLSGSFTFRLVSSDGIEMHTERVEEE